MAIKLLLIRHAESTDNLQGRFSGLRNVELTKNGINQAEKLSLRLQNTKIDEIYCSNLKRAKHTAEIVFKNRGLKIQVNSKFSELNVGAWEGQTYDEVKKKFGYGDEFNRWMGNVGTKISIPQGEDIKNFINKVVNELYRILKNNSAADKDMTIVLVCHGVVIRAILSNALKLDLSDMWRIEQDSTALTIITYFNKEIIVNLVNDTSHLENWWKINEDL